mgnify:CR=1 FL=1
MTDKPIKISQEASVQMPFKTVASLIAMVAIGTWAYFGLHETLNNHSTQIELMPTLALISVVFFPALDRIVSRRAL